MRSVNRITLIGNVGADPEVRTTGSGQKLAKVSLATTERWSGKTGQTEERTDWHRLTLWNRLAQFAEDYVRTGDRIYVEGSVRYSTAERDGVTTYWTEVNVRELVMLGSKSERATAGVTGSSAGDEFDDGMPF